MSTRLSARAAVALLAAALPLVSCGDGPGEPPPRVARVELTAPDTLELATDGSATAVPRAADGTALTGRAVVWTVSDPGVLRVTGAGALRALAPGAVRLVAESEGARAELAVSVIPRRVRTLSVTGAADSLYHLDTLRLAAAPLDFEGQTLARAVAWSSSDTTVARVGADGLLEARRTGSAELTATSEGARATRTVHVRRDALVRVQWTGLADSLTVGTEARLVATGVWRSGRAHPVALAAGSRAAAVATFAPEGEATVLRAAQVGSTSVELTAVGRSPAVAAGLASPDTVRLTGALKVVPVPVVRFSLAAATFSPFSGTQVTFRLTSAVDSLGRTVTDPPVRWGSDQPRVLDVSPAGVAVGGEAGSATLTVVSGRAVTRLAIAVRRPAAIRARLRSSALAPGHVDSVVVRPLDERGAESSTPFLPGALSWEVADPRVAQVDARTGVVRGLAGGSTTVRVALSGGGAAATLPVEVLGDAPLGAYFDVRVAPDVPPHLVAGVRWAVARWELALRTRVAPFPLSLPAGACSPNQPTLSGTFSRVVLFVDAYTESGTGIAGFGGACVLQAGSRLPAVGRIRLNLANTGAFDTELAAALALHEIGHVLGISSGWWNTALAVGQGTSAPRFVGPAAVARYRAAGGTDPVGVPIETAGGSGTAGAHWLREPFSTPDGTETMIGFLSWRSPLSAVTLGALQDVGHVVDFRAADPFRVAAPAPAPAPVASGERRASPEVAAAGNDELPPLFTLQGDGRVVRLPR